MSKPSVSLPKKCVIFDFVGTLVSVENYSMEQSKHELYEAICQAGFSVEESTFLKAYSEAHEKYRVTRYEDLIEVTNGVWVSEALTNLGFKTTPEDARVKAAINVFFLDYLMALKLKPCSRNLLARLSQTGKLGLISNFTYAPVIYNALRKLKIGNYFDAVLVSQEVGWRKPHRQVFETALKRLGASAKDTTYVGDSPLEDIAGAKKAGMKTVFVPSQFYTLQDLEKSGQLPDFVAKDLCQLLGIIGV